MLSLLYYHYCVIPPLLSLLCYPSCVIPPVLSLLYYPSCVIPPVLSLLCYHSSVITPLLSLLCYHSSVITPLLSLLCYPSCAIITISIRTTYRFEKQRNNPLYVKVLIWLTKFTDRKFILLVSKSVTLKEKFKLAIRISLIVFFSFHVCIPGT